MFNRYSGEFRWENVPLLAYKEEEGTHFKSITRQVLIEGQPELPCQLRYFEIAPNGYSTLEHHEHVHYVMIFRGEGSALIGNEIRQVREKDVLVIPPLAWHQFRATPESPLGFLCLVHMERDKVKLPTEEDMKLLQSDSQIAAFIQC